MPVDFAGADSGTDGEWVISGRVVANPFANTVLVAEGPHRIQVNGEVGHLAPGDLVRIRAVPDSDPEELVVPPDTSYPVYRALAAELVYRPTRAPWGSNTETGAMMREALRQRLWLRAGVLDKIREYFKRQQFLEVETPAVVTSPGLDLHLHAYQVVPATGPDRGPDESGRRASAAAPPKPFGYLITSPEYHMKRLLVGGIPRCFQLAKCFRADEIGARHEPEFTMLEWYRAWARVDDVMADTENVLRAASNAGPTPGVIVVGEDEVALDQPFDRLTVREAFARHAPGEGDPIALAARDEDRYFSILVELIEPNLGRDRPAFLTHYPATQASLARIAPEDPTVCERFELYVNGVELSNGFVELTDPVEQHLRLERDQRERAARGLPVYPIDERFLWALEEGMPPSVGNALGLDRLVALVSGHVAIADVIAFPHARR